MKSNLGLLIKSLMLAGFLLCPVPVFAEDSANQKNVVTEHSSGLWPDEITLDGQVFKKDQLNQAFLDAVFIADVLNKRGEQLVLGIPVEMPRDWILHPETLKVGYPWLYPHVYPQDGLPRTLSANKWVKPVRISFGMPNGLKPYVPNKMLGTDTLFYSNVNVEEIERFFDTPVAHDIVNDISEISSVLNDLTGLNVSFKNSDAESADVKGFGIQINFITMDKNLEKYRFKARDLRGFVSAYVGRFMVFRGDTEDYIKTGFPFTPVSAKQVDGYILSNSKNEIQAAVCYIWIGHEPEMIKALVRECLIRSLGLPGAMRMNFAQRPVPVSYLTLWNDPEKWSESYRSQVKTPSELSEFDQYMIRTLYNPAIKPGMDYVAAQRILLGTEY
ncbi:MAG: hypothetical protein NDJ24_00300 [Alphaproteobacteria bacterium]|nr:hypothetical protein [Alphaproteobacteria bacterium]